MAYYICTGTSLIVDGVHIGEFVNTLEKYLADF